MAHQLPQPLLFSPAVIEAITADEAKGIYTAERCPPDKRDAIIDLRGRGWSKRRIQELLKVHRLTVVAIEEAHPEAVDAVRQRTTRQLRRCVTDQLDRIEENPTLVPASSIPMMVGVFTDKAELLDGRATARVETIETVNIYEDWDSFVEKQLQPGDVREITGPEMRLAGEKSPPIEAALGSGSGPTAGQVQTPGRSVTDDESDAQQGEPIESHGKRPDKVNRSESEHGMDPAPAGGPPGGGSPPQPGQNGPTHKEPEKILPNETLL